MVLNITKKKKKTKHIGFIQLNEWNNVKKDMFIKSRKLIKYDTAVRMSFIWLPLFEESKEAYFTILLKEY